MTKKGPKNDKKPENYFTACLKIKLILLLKCDATFLIYGEEYVILNSISDFKQI